MKKKLFVSLLLLVVGCLSFQSYAADETTPEEIELKKVVKDGGSRMPGQNEVPVFSANYTSEVLMVNAENYTGNIQVEIIGVNGFTTNFTVSGSGSSSIDISTLTAGIYTLRITTSTSIYTGQFIL